MAGIKGRSGRKAGETMETVYVKLPLKVLVACKHEAKRDSRTLSGYLRKLIEDVHQPDTL